MQQAQIFVYSDSPAFARIDTIVVAGGDFDYSTPLAEPTVLTMLYPNFSETMFIAEPGIVLKYKADASNMRYASITGTSANDSLTAFRQAYATQPLPVQRKAAEQYIRQHPADYASMALFCKYFERVEQIQAEPTTTLLKLLVKEHPDHLGLKALQARMQPLLHYAEGAQLTLADLPAAAVSRKFPALVIFTHDTQYQSSMLRQNATDYCESHGVTLIEVETQQADIDSLIRHAGLRYVPGWIYIDENGRVAQRDKMPFSL